MMHKANLRYSTVFDFFVTIETGLDMYAGFSFSLSNHSIRFFYSKTKRDPEFFHFGLTCATFVINKKCAFFVENAKRKSNENVLFVIFVFKAKSSVPLLLDVSDNPPPLPTPL